MADPVIVEGRWAVDALLDSEYFIPRRIFVDRGRHKQTVAKASAIGIPIEEQSSDQLSARAGYHFQRGIFAEADRPAPRDLDTEFLATAKKIVIPVGLADPGNLGTIVRTGAAFGADGVIVERDRGADIYSRKSIRASATAIFRLPVFECVSIASVSENLKASRFVLFATTVGAGAVPISQVQPAEKSAILLGTESDGLSAEVLSLCDETLRIPMANEMDSLNVAASAAVVMWELFGKSADEQG